METFAFWREMELRFRALPDPNGRLHASYSDAGSEEFLSAMRDRLILAIHAAVDDPAYPPDAIFSFARSVAHLAGWHLDGVYIQQWLLSGGPEDRLAREALQSRFRSEAALAAAAADAVAHGATDDQALDGWMELLRSKQSPYYRGDDFRWIDCLGSASAEMCADLAKDAYKREAAARVKSAERPSAPAVVGNPLPSPASTEADTSKLLTMKEAADKLKVHEDTLRAMGKRGEIEIITIGRRSLRIKASKILRLRKMPKFDAR